jgi:glutathione S-transferase
VLITLAEKQLAFSTRKIDLFQGEQYSPAYLRINPKGVVPALVHDGRIVTESTLICEYLDDIFPTPQLIPADPYARTLMRKWSKAVDETLFEATRELSFSAMFRERMRSMTPAQREARFRNVGDLNKRARFMSTYEHGVESPYVLQAITAWETAFRNMEKALAGGATPRPWLAADTMTLADANMMPFVARIAYLGLLDVFVAQRPAVRQWWAQVQEQDSFRAAVPGALTSADLETMSRSGATIRQRVAALRDEHLKALERPPA